MSQEKMTIRIRDMELPVVLGVFPEERLAPRIVSLHLDIVLAQDAARHAAERDDLAHTIDYAALETSIAQLLLAKTYLLLEHLCAAVADLVLADAKAQSVRVEIVKAGALRCAPAVAMLYEKHRRADPTSTRQTLDKGKNQNGEEHAAG